MDNTKKTSHQKKPKSNLLLSCFGFSIQPVIEGNDPSTMVISITTSGTSKEEKKRNWFSLSSFRFKSSGVARTVPVDSSITSEKAIDGKKAPARKSKAVRAKKGGDSDSGRNHSKRNKKIPSANPAANQELSRQITATPEVASAEGPPEDQNPVRQMSEQRIVLGNGKPLEHVDARSKTTWQTRQSFRRKVDALRSGNGHPGLPNIEPKLARAGPASTRSHENPASNPSRVVAAKNPPKENGEKVYDPMIGMSIIMVTLLIMLVWGRVCAILCTCAWFYFVPLLRNMVDQNETTKTRESGPVEPDLDSEEHKKRVVLEGLLERSHHRSVG